MKTNNVLTLTQAFVTIVVIVCLIHSSPVDAAEETTYLVNAVGLKGNFTKSVSDAITNQICNDLSKSVKNAEVHCPDDVKALLKAKQDMLSLGAGNPDKLMQQASSLLKADRGISGNLSQIGKTAMLQLKMMDYNNGKVLGRASASIAVSEINDILKKIPDLLIQMLKPKKSK